LRSLACRWCIQGRARALRPFLVELQMQQDCIGRSVPPLTVPNFKKT
jgi:hypothetical protein